MPASEATQNEDIMMMMMMTTTIMTRMKYYRARYAVQKALNTHVRLHKQKTTSNSKHSKTYITRAHTHTHTHTHTHIHAHTKIDR